MSRFLLRIAILLLGVSLTSGFMTLSANTAHADITTTNDGSSVTVTGHDSDHSSVHWKGTLVQWLSIKFTPAQKKRLTKPSNCIWADGRNYYSTVDTSHGWHSDTHMRLCRSSKSPTGWVKVGGGQSGSACFNVASPYSVPPLPGVPEIKGPITEVRSFAKFFAKAKASSFIHLHVIKSCPGVYVETDMRVKGSAVGRSLFKLFRETKGQIKEFQAKLRTRLALSASSSSSVSLFIQCTEGPDTPDYGPPTVVATPKACVKEGEQTGIVTVRVTNPNAIDDTAKVTVGSAAQTLPVKANSFVDFTFNGFGPGTYPVTALLEKANKSLTTSVTVAKCDTPVAPAPDVTLNTMNQVIENKSTTTGLSVTVYGGNSATVTISALWGQITTTKTFTNVTGSWSTTIGYTAPGEVPDGSQSFSNTPAPPAGYDQVRVVVVDNVTNKQVVAYTNVKITPFIPAP